MGENKEENMFRGNDLTMQVITKFVINREVPAILIRTILHFHTTENLSSNARVVPDITTK